MLFYRAMTPIKAMTFDLDDTLYDNVPVIKKAEQSLNEELVRITGLNQFTVTDFNLLKQHVLTLNPDIYHDVVAWRQMTIRYLGHQYGIVSQDIELLVDHLMDHFTYWRHQIEIPAQTHQVLSYLAERIPLAVITNGNVEIEKIGLADYFQFSLRGGIDGRSKPFADTFALAARQLNLPSQQILHVGDNLYTDVLGAVEQGMQACWINLTGQTIAQQSDARLLPHIEITDLVELKSLL
ncbi:5-amino-6-(5-phospho-D-ribitylamino)uracil phosphatase YigB [Utexia brackfieldae]|uniref:5-amino-6-(5-phospho-D-ribitylamino)uracil phosphatase YigB n=1 Tax=Utexia brackfieldae TaxID=3074108 RepID=UPI00370DA304